MEVLEEKEKKVWDMAFDMTTEERAALLAIGEKIYPEEQREQDILQYVVVHALQEIVDNPEKLKTFLERKGEQNEQATDTD